MHTCRTDRVIARAQRLIPLAAVLAVHDASAALPDVSRLITWPWGAWTAFALAITVVIVLLLWHAIGDERGDAPARRGRSPRRAAPSPPLGDPPLPSAEASSPRDSASSSPTGRPDSPADPPLRRVAVHNHGRTRPVA